MRPAKKDSTIDTHRIEYGELQRRRKDIVEHRLSVLVVKRGLSVSRFSHTHQACDHLVQQRSHRPPVHGSSIGMSQQHLGSHVFRGSYIALCLLLYHKSYERSPRNCL